MAVQARSRACFRAICRRSDELIGLVEEDYWSGRSGALELS